MTTPTKPTKQPNIILFLIDDLGWMDLGCYGSTFYETPNLDKLAAQGLRFTNAYASCPVCSPSRASVMSGKYPARVGITNWIGARDRGRLAEVPYLHYLPHSETSVATALRDAGYATWHVGKWHLGDDDYHPQHHGFDVNIAGCHLGRPKNGYFAPWKIEHLDDHDVPEGTYLTDHLTDKAIDLVKQRDAEQPFFLHFSHYAVHTPIQAPPELVKKYQKKCQRLHLNEVDPVVTGEHFPVEHKQRQRVQRRIIQSHAEYAAMIENLDSNIGRFVDMLAEEGLDDNTLIVFTSDNGGLATAEGCPTCNLPLSEGKGWNREGGIRVCQIAHWPGHIRAGTVTSTPVTSTDFYPTFLDVANIPQRPEQHCDGLSLLPLFNDHKTLLEREGIFWHYPHYGNQGDTPFCSMISQDGQWKLTEHFEDGRLELFDLVNDISEGTNLVDQYPDKTKSLHEQLCTWRDDIEAIIPQTNPDWQPPRPANNAYD